MHGRPLDAYAAQGLNTPPPTSLSPMHGRTSSLSDLPPGFVPISHTPIVAPAQIPPEIMQTLPAGFVPMSHTPPVQMQPNLPEEEDSEPGTAALFDFLSDLPAQSPWQSSNNILDNVAAQARGSAYREPLPLSASNSLDGRDFASSRVPPPPRPSQVALPESAPGSPYHAPSRVPLPPSRSSTPHGEPVSQVSKWMGGAQSLVAGTLRHAGELVNDALHDAAEGGLRSFWSDPLKSLRASEVPLPHSRPASPWQNEADALELGYLVQDEPRAPTPPPPPVTPPAPIGDKDDVIVQPTPGARPWPVTVLEAIRPMYSGLPDLGEDEDKDDVSEDSDHPMPGGMGDLD
jgi:hypothetical protein